jgi:uncharacterized membrane protein
MVIKWIVASTCVVFHPDSPLQSPDQPIEAQIRWLAIALIFVMIAALIYTVRMVVRSFRGTVMVVAPSWEKYVTPLLALIGMAVASSLTSVQTQVVEANVDPVGDCLAVLNSPYTRLLDTFPVGVMGWQAYSIVFWAGLWTFAPGKSVRKTYRWILVLTIAGTIFSLYLTYLEAFVIKASCWRCLLSATTMTLLMIVTLVPALQGARRSRIPVLRGSRRKKGAVFTRRAQAHRPLLRGLFYPNIFSQGECQTSGSSDR